MAMSLFNKIQGSTAGNCMLLKTLAWRKSPSIHGHMYPGCLRAVWEKLHKQDHSVWSHLGPFFE